MSDFQSNSAFSSPNPSYSPYHAVLPPHPRRLGKKLITLWVLVDGDPSPFKVSVHRTADVDYFKGAIKEKTALPNLNHSHLVVWMLFNAEPVEPEDTLLQRIRSRGNVGEFAKRLTATQTLSTLFPRSPIKNHVYILVQLPSTNNSRPLTLGQSAPLPPQNASPRRNTVAALYEKLKKYAFILVRGTPGSGKTVLSHLLAAYISETEPDVKIIWIGMWPSEEKRNRNYESYLIHGRGWNPQEKTVFIFDEGQLTYDDEELWSYFFKSIYDYREKRCAIIFASYGSPTSRMSIRGTPMLIPDVQQVTLRGINHGDGLAPVGLLFTTEELHDLIAWQYPSSDFYFDTSFFESLFVITSGHIGAIQDFISVIIADLSYRELKNAYDQRYTWNLFLAKVSPHALLRKLENTSKFARGLPSNRKLQVPATAAVLSAVLRDNVITYDDFTTADEKTALQECFRNGWLHADNLGPDLPDDTGYVFPSSLHRWYVEWKLSDTPSTQSFQADSLQGFIIDVIHRFSPRQLAAERRIGPASLQRLPEAHYQDEFYRCCYDLSEGSLITFPEYGTANGRVDFYIPAKSWGIELLRDGCQLASHCGRFSEAGAYNTSLSLSDHVIIDCCTTHPTEVHEHMPKLYHAVFTDNFQSVHILDHRLRVVKNGKFPLLMH